MIFKIKIDNSSNTCVGYLDNLIEQYNYKSMIKRLLDPSFII